MHRRMKARRALRIPPALSALCCLISCASPSERPAPQSKPEAAEPEMAQVPAWSRRDLDTFLHGSMSTEVVPETVLRAFIRTYPDLFPSQDLSHLGLIPDPAFGWPVGFSRSRVAHLGGMQAVGVNCAACHVGEVCSPPGAALRVLGMTAHFDPEAFFGAVTVATFRTEDPANMKRFLAAWLAENEPAGGQRSSELLATQWQRHEQEIVAAISADPSGSKDVAPGGLHQIAAADLRLDAESLAGGADLAALCRSILKLFHNMRAALHIPDQPPEKLPPPSGPGRNDAFGLLSAELFAAPQPTAPVKFGLVWNLENRHWVHWDGNTQSPIGRNLLASLGLGAPLLGKRAYLDFAAVKRQTDLSQRIHPPRYPFAIDGAAAKRGAALYQARCASCHDGPEGDRRLHAPSEIGTEPQRAELFTQLQADRFNSFLAGLETPGYRPPSEPGLRSTQEYWAPGLGGVWARSPYLHNGSVRTMQELLTAPSGRARAFRRGSRVYDGAAMGYADEGPYLFDVTGPGNSNSGHDYGTDLSSPQKRELIEYLKTL